MDQPATRASYRGELILILGLLALVGALRAPGFPQPFDNDSAAIAYHGRLINQGLALYGEHHPGHHMPAVYYVYAAVFRLLGDGVAAIKLALVPWTFLVAFLLYRTGTRLFDRGTGIVAAMIYAVLSSDLRLLGLTGEIELWANLPRTLGFYLVVLALSRRGSPWLWGLVGLAGAASLSFKAVYISPPAVGGGVLLLELLRAPARRGALRGLLVRATWLILGLAAGVAPLLGLFAAQGVLDRFLWTFRLGRDYVSLRTVDVAWYRTFTTPLRGMARTNAVVLALGLAGLVSLSMGRLKVRDRAQPLYPLALWFVVSILEAGVTRVNFMHYHLLVLPPLALLAAPLAAAGYRRLRGRLAARPAWVRRPLLALVVAVVLLAGYKRNLRLTGHWLRLQLGAEDFQTYLVGGWYLGSDLVRVSRVAEYVKAHTLPEDRIYYWSSDMQLYYLSERRCAADFIWPVDAESTGAQSKILAPTTKYILVGENRYVPVPDWLEQGLARDYVLETVIDEQRIYRRIASPAAGPAALATGPPATYSRCHSSKTSSA